jgi:hypothetical protein
MWYHATVGICYDKASVLFLNFRFVIVWDSILKTCRNLLQTPIKAPVLSHKCGHFRKSLIVEVEIAKSHFW